jgi:diaminopimelate epimerase
MKLELTKHHGLGNDFLVLFDAADLGLLETDLVELAVRLCDRRRGIGADGLLIGESEDGYAARMVLYNADGSRAEMSGNGIRCFAQALSGRRGDLTPQCILTDAGPRLVTLFATEAPDTIDASVDMGPIGRLDAPGQWDDLGAHPDRPVMHLDLGNPHSVVGVDEVLTVDLLTLGRKVPLVNLEIVEPGPEPHGITMRVHERGAGITEACGSGACASAWAAAAWGLVPGAAAEIVVHMDGGDARVRLNDPEPGHVTLIGPAVLVASMEVEMIDLPRTIPHRTVEVR